MHAYCSAGVAAALPAGMVGSRACTAASCTTTQSTQPRCRSILVKQGLGPYMLQHTEHSLVPTAVTAADLLPCLPPPLPQDAGLLAVPAVLHAAAPARDGGGVLAQRC